MIVVIQRVRADPHDKQIGVAVIVVIGYSNSDIVPATGNACRRSDIGELAAAVVSEQPVRVLGSVFLQRLDVCAVGKKYVRPPVVVVIEYGYATRHGCGRMTHRGFIVLKTERDRLQLKPDGNLGVLRRPKR